MRMTFFDIKQDNQCPCFCEACLLGKSEEQMSGTDKRYCAGCQHFIEEEYAVIAELHSRKTSYEPVGYIEMDTAKQKEVLLPIKNGTSQIYQNLTENRPIPSVGGRPKKDVPTKLIKELSGKGMGIKRIVTELKTQGEAISAMTVSRVLSGERK